MRKCEHYDSVHDYVCHAASKLGATQQWQRIRGFRSDVLYKLMIDIDTDSAAEIFVVDKWIILLHLT